MSGESTRVGVPWWGPAVSAVTLVLVLVRLGGSSVWSDESITAILGAHILKFGLPRVQDGPLVVQWIVGDAREGIWAWNGWIQDYLSAAGEAIFGRTALGARFFHAVIGALVPWAAYPLFRAMSPKRGVAEAATLLTGLSVPLIVYWRQAHYHAEGTLLTLLLLRAYHAVLQERPRATICLVLAAVLLFNTFFVWFFLIGVALALHVVVLRPRARVVARLVTAAAAALLIVAPFAIWARVWSRDWIPGGAPPKHPYYLLAHLRYYVLELNLYAAPFVILLLGGAAAAGRGRPGTRIACLAGAILVPVALAGPHTPVAFIFFIFILALSVFLGAARLLAEAAAPREARGWMPLTLVALLSVTFVAAFTKSSPYPFFRYLIPLLPLLALVSAQALFTLLPRPWLAWGAVGILAITNAASVWPIRLAVGLDPVAAVVERGRSAPELQSVALPRWTDLPNLHSALTSEWLPEVSPNLQARSPLIDYLGEITHDFRGPVDAIAEYINARKRPGDRFFIVWDKYPVVYHTGLPFVEQDPLAEPPRWVIPRHLWGRESLQALKWIQNKGYQEIELDAVDTTYENHSDPDLHVFRTVRNGPHVRIWERKEGTGR